VFACFEIGCERLIGCESAKLLGVAFSRDFEWVERRRDNRKKKKEEREIKHRNIGTSERKETRKKSEKSNIFCSAFHSESKRGKRGKNPKDESTTNFFFFMGNKIG